MPGATDYEDTRATAVVDVVIGPQFPRVGSADDVAAALQSGAAAQASC